MMRSATEGAFLTALPSPRAQAERGRQAGFAAIAAGTRPAPIAMGAGLG